MNIDHELALEFLRKAEHDLGAARLLIAGNDFFDAVCFHCQQLAEKSVKALLTHKSIRFKKIHNLEILLGMLEDPDFNNYSNNAVILNSYAVDSRYPGEYAEPEQEEAEEALRMSLQIYEIVKKKLTP